MPDQPPSPDVLEAELVALGRTLTIGPPPADFAERVLTRIAQTESAYAVGPARSIDAPTDVVSSVLLSRSARLSSRFPSWVSGWRGALGPGRRRALAAVVAALLVVVLVPPVRAAVLDLFRIGGVSVREIPAPSGGSASEGRGVPTTPPAVSAPSAPSADTVVGSLAEASDRVGFDVTAPSLLGDPTVIAVTHEGRVVELTWGVGATSTRLDIFDGSLSFGYLKSVWQAVTPTRVGGNEAVWFADAHLIEWTDRSGRTVSAPPRVAGPTLVWVTGVGGRDELTHRLEGPTTLGAARAIAESMP